MEEKEIEEKELLEMSHKDEKGKRIYKRYTPEEDVLLVELFEADKTDNTKEAKFNKIKIEFFKRGYARTATSLASRYSYLQDMQEKEEKKEKNALFDIILSIAKLSKEDLKFVKEFIDYARND